MPVKTTCEHFLIKQYLILACGYIINTLTWRIEMKKIIPFPRTPSIIILWATNQIIQLIFSHPLTNLTQTLQIRKSSIMVI
ncbi:hypothetical protein BvCmsSINP041_03728 [Escherichia coli]|nr:hypothetical protein BvCmsSINP041_03728 [Escherichia coli]